MFKIFLLLSFLTPTIASAAIFNNACELFSFFTGFIKTYVIGLLVALATVYFLWGAGKFIKNAEDTKAREEGKNFMIYGIIGLFVIVAFWGIVTALINTFDVGTVLPGFPAGGNVGCV